MSGNGARRAVGFERRDNFGVRLALVLPADGRGARCRGRGTRARRGRDRPRAAGARFAKTALHLLRGQDHAIDALFGGALHQLVALVLFGIHLHAQIEALDAVAARPHGCGERLRAVDRNLRDVEPRFAAAAAALT